MLPAEHLAIHTFVDTACCIIVRRTTYGSWKKKRIDKETCRKGQEARRRASIIVRLVLYYTASKSRVRKQFSGTP